MRFILFFSLAIPIGVLAIAAGEADDSPGLQGLGLILLITVFWKSLQRTRETLKRQREKGSD
jgi:hypothetical protein